MQYHLEPLNGGLVMNRHPLLMNPGEVQASYELFYPPEYDTLDVSPRKASSISMAGLPIGTTSRSLWGFTQVILDTPPYQLPENYNFAVMLTQHYSLTSKPTDPDHPAYASSYGYHYFSANALGSGFSIATAFTGDFTTAGPITTSTLDHTLLTDNVEITASHMASGESSKGLYSVSLGETALLLNGASKNAVVLPSRALRDHGIEPCSMPPVVTTAGTASTARTNLTATGWWEYWVTPVRKYDYGALSYSDSVEGAYSVTEPTVVHTTGEASATLITVAKPALPSDATHWKVYRSVTPRPLLHPLLLLVYDIHTYCSVVLMRILMMVFLVHINILNSVLVKLVERPYLDLRVFLVEKDVLQICGCL